MKCECWYQIIYKRNERSASRAGHQAEYLCCEIDLQDFLIALLNDVQKYFQASGPMSEEKVVTSLNLIFGKVQREFPLISSIDNLSKRIAKDLKVKIADVSTTR